MSEKTLKPCWRQVKLGDVVHLSKARSLDLLGNGIERHLGLEHFEPGDVGIRSSSNVADGVTSTSVFQSGQVLFGKRRAFRQQIEVPVETWDGLVTEDIERA